MRLTLQPLRREGIHIFPAIPVQYLCSQLIEVKPRDGTHPPESYLLEEISPRSVVLSCFRPLQPGTSLLISADGYEAMVTVTKFDVREDGYAVRCDFAHGFEWSPSLWTPAHLYEVKGAPKTKAAGAS